MKIRISALNTFCFWDRTGAFCWLKSWLNLMKLFRNRLAWMKNPYVCCIIIDPCLAVHIQLFQVGVKVFFKIDAPSPSKIMLKVEEITSLLMVKITVKPVSAVFSSVMLFYQVCKGIKVWRKSPHVYHVLDFFGAYYFTCSSQIFQRYVFYYFVKSQFWHGNNLVILA